MNPVKRTVIIKEGDRVVHEGPDRRNYSEEYGAYSSQKPVIFNMFTIKEFINFCFYAVTVCVFLLVSDKRITLMEENIKLFTGFVRNSDTFHSSVTGVEFSNGRPVNSFDSQRVRNVLKGKKQINVNLEEIN